MSLRTCAGCTTAYAPGLDVCPHCGSTEYAEDGVKVDRRLPLFVSVRCECGRGPWQLRLPMLMPGLIQLSDLFCASCGSQVQVPWPPVEDDMSPKITRHGGATNARDAGPSPDASASAPLVGAEADQGHPTAETESVPDAEDASPEGSVGGEDADAEETFVVTGTVASPAADYEGMTLAELRTLAAERDVPSYGTKAQIAERLREADAEG